MAIQKITGDVIATSAVTADSLADTTITAAKLHTTLDLTGKTVTVATASAGDNDTTVASTAFVSTAVANLADSAPSTLDTLNELAAALGDDANFSTTVTTSIAAKAPLASPAFTGNVGIGVSTVGRAPLHVHQTTDNTDANIHLTSNETGSTGNDGFTISVSGAGANDLDAYLIQRENANLRFYTNATEKMRIDASGKVGIGTDNPVSLLSVQGDGLQIRMDGTANTSRGIILRNTGTAEGQIQTDGNMHFIQEDAGKYMRFSTANTEAMRIDSSGNVGIGTDNTNSFKTYIDASGKGLFVEAGDNGYTALGFDGDALATKGSITSHNGKLLIGSENSSGTGSNGELKIIPGTGNVMMLDECLRWNWRNLSTTQLTY
jgi:hypothetical protein